MQRATRYFHPSQHRRIGEKSKVFKEVHHFPHNLQGFIKTHSLHAATAGIIFSAGPLPTYVFFQKKHSSNMPKHLADDVHKPHRT